MSKLLPKQSSKGKQSTSTPEQAWRFIQMSLPLADEINRSDDTDGSFNELSIQIVRCSGAAELFKKRFERNPQSDARHDVAERGRERQPQ